MMGITSTGLNQILSITLLVVLNLLPFIYSCILIRKGDELKNENNEKRYGNLYIDQRLKTLEDPPKKRNVWLYTMIFMVRRTIFVVLTVFGIENPHMPLICHSILTLGTACYLASSNIFKEKSRQRIEIANEMLLLTVSVLLKLCLPKITS